MFIACIHLDIVCGFEAPICNPITIIAITAFIQRCSTFLNIEQSHSRQKTIGVISPFFKLLIVVNIWYSFVCLHSQTSESLILGRL